jgi:hypothetical protein
MYCGVYLLFTIVILIYVKLFLNKQKRFSCLFHFFKKERFDAHLDSKLIFLLFFPTKSEFFRSTVIKMSARKSCDGSVDGRFGQFLLFQCIHVVLA